MCFISGSGGRRSGVMALSLSAVKLVWRKNRAECKVRRCLHASARRARFPDQWGGATVSFVFPPLSREQDKTKQEENDPRHEKEDTQRHWEQHRSFDAVED